jgi:hypothetical protein
MLFRIINVFGYYKLEIIMDFEKYKSKLPYPDRADFERIDFGKIGIRTERFAAKDFLDSILATPALRDESVVKALSRGMKSKEIMDILENYGFMSKISFDSINYERAVEQYYCHAKELQKLFEADLLAEHGVDDIPAHLTEPFLSMAIDEAKSYGHNGIACKFSLLMQAATPLIDAYRASMVSSA